MPSCSYVVKWRSGLTYFLILQVLVLNMDGATESVSNCPFLLHDGGLKDIHAHEGFLITFLSVSHLRSFASNKSPH